MFQVSTQASTAVPGAPHATPSTSSLDLLLLSPYSSSLGLTVSLSTMLPATETNTSLVVAEKWKPPLHMAFLQEVSKSMRPRKDEVRCHVLLNHNHNHHNHHHNRPSSPQPSRRRTFVSFTEARVVGTVPHLSSLSSEERNQTWYKYHELETFKEEARSLCRSMARNHEEKQRLKQRGATTDSVSITATETMDSSRGLESRVCIRRQRNKAMTTRCILKAQASGRERQPEFIAAISLQCTLYAREVAVAQAAIDFCQVYQPHLLPFLPRTQDLPQHPFPIKAKSRTASCSRIDTTATTKSQSEESLPLSKHNVTRHGKRSLEQERRSNEVHNNQVFNRNVRSRKNNNNNCF